MTPSSLAGLISRYKLDHHAAAIRAGLVPALCIRTSESSPNPSSRLGGTPDLPPGEPWPEAGGHPLHFLGQIRLSEIPRDHVSDFPEQGWLRFWYDTIEESDRESRTEIDTTVWDPPLAHLTFDPDESRRVSTRAWPEAPDDFEPLWCEWEPFRETALSFEPIWCLDHVAARALFDAEEAADRKNGWTRVYDFLCALERREKNRPNHRLRGDLYEMQSNSRFAAACMAAQVAEFADHTDAEKAALDQAAADYRLLFLLDSDPDGTGFSWGDAGSLQWWIRRQDLSAGNLDRAVGLYEQGS